MPFGERRAIAGTCYANSRRKAARARGGAHARSRQGTQWLDVLKIQACYRLIDPESEWRPHRDWYEHSALRDLLGCERTIAGDTLYHCLDKLLAHKQDFFSFLRARWAPLFDARFGGRTAGLALDGDATTLTPGGGRRMAALARRRGDQPERGHGRVSRP